MKRPRTIAISSPRTAGLRPLIVAVGTALLVACAARQEDAKPPVSQPHAMGRVLPENRPIDGPNPIQGQPSVADTEAEPARDRDKATTVELMAVVPEKSSAVSQDRASNHRRVAEIMVASAGTRAPARAFMKHRTSIAPAPCCFTPPAEQNTENYQALQENPVHRATEQPVSTFSIDVDTGSYANVRRFLNAGQLPPEDAVRVEELLNYFDYDYPAPASRDTPFRVSTELAPTPWNPDSQLLRIGIKGYAVPASERPASNLVFLIDVSGSMQSPDKLPLLRNAFRLLTQQLSSRDRVSIVVYAGSTGVVLDPTPGDHKQKILGAIGDLEAGGSTNGGEGIERAYRLAHESFIKGGINRVILATDGDFNVGTVNFEALVDKAERERTSGIALTTLGFGTGNYNEKLLERLADAGNGNYAYVDTLSEARKVLVEELSSTLFTIARDVKIQVEFNPAVVAEYRLIGYENRILAREDFNNDQVDAGDIGAGHRVTALYEVVPVGKRGHIDPLRYGGSEERTVPRRENEELAFVRLRYKTPDSSAGNNVSKLIEFPVASRSLLPAGKQSADFRFATSVAAFGQKLHGGKYLGTFGYDDIRALAKSAAGEDKQGYRREFLALVDLAETLQPGIQKGELMGALTRISAE